MHSLAFKLQAEVQARRQQPSAQLGSIARVVGVGLAIALVAFTVGARGALSNEAGWATEWQQRFQAGDARLHKLEGELELRAAEIERLQRVHKYSAKYGIGADLAAAIEEIALAENIDPKLAFELVRLESGFKREAVSPVGALGYTQLMPETARLLSPGITRADIMDRDTNLRLGFRFLNGLIRKYDGNVHLALLAYNRGPVRVDNLIRTGEDPSNGYSSIILNRIRKAW